MALSLVLKRGLNVVVIFATLAAAVLALVATGLLAGGVSNWNEFIAGAIFPVVAVFIAVFIANYVFFGRANVVEQGAGR